MIQPFFGDASKGILLGVEDRQSAAKRVSAKQDPSPDRGLRRASAYRRLARQSFGEGGWRRKRNWDPTFSSRPGCLAGWRLLEPEATAHPFDVTFRIHTDRYQYISAKFEALNIGHAAITSYTFKNNRDKGRRSLPVKTVNKTSARPSSPSELYRRSRPLAEPDTPTRSHKDLGSAP